MKRNADHIAGLIWARGHLAFFILNLCCVGVLAPFASAAALFISLPAIIIYFPLTGAVATHIRRAEWRIAALLAGMVLITEVSFRTACYLIDGAYWTIEPELRPLYGSSLASTAISVCSLWNKLKDPSPISPRHIAQS